MIKSIPLNKLVASPRNVRRASDQQADLELKADIEARGLLQNLVVTSVSKPRGCFAVEAGERRRRALQSLADEGKLPRDHEVCCLVVEADSAHEASLAENFQRLSMNPADECLAFQQLIEQGATVEDVARRFGLTVRFVEGRLRLANLAPVVFEALGAGEISLDVAKAYAATPDRERQEYVFEQMGRGYGANHPDSIRRMMTQATVSASDRRAKFVGEDAYVAAGGRIERDLFSDEAAARWLDVALLERLACEKMEVIAAETAKVTGLAFVRPTLYSWIGYSQTEGLRRIPLESPPLSDEESAQVDDLEGEIEDLVGLLEDEETEPGARQEAEAKIREIAAADITQDAVEPAAEAQRLQQAAFRDQQQLQYYAFETEYRRLERDKLLERAAQLREEIAERLSKVDENEREQIEKVRERERLESELKSVSDQLGAAQETKRTKIALEHLPTPMAKTVFSRELHIRLKGQRVTVIPWDRLVATLKEHAPLAARRSASKKMLDDKLGPINGFMLHYRMSAIPGGFELERFEIDVTPENVGELMMVQAARPPRRRNHGRANWTPGTSTCAAMISRALITRLPSS